MTESLRSARFPLGGLQKRSRNGTEAEFILYPRSKFLLQFARVLQTLAGSGSRRFAFSGCQASTLVDTLLDMCLARPVIVRIAKGLASHSEDFKQQQRQLLDPTMTKSVAELKLNIISSSTSDVSDDSEYCQGMTTKSHAETQPGFQLADHLNCKGGEF